VKQRIFATYFRQLSQLSNIETRTRMEIADRLLRLSKPNFSPVQVAELTKLPEDTVKQLSGWVGRKIVVSFRDETLTRLELLNYFRSYGDVENLSFRSNKAFVTFKYSDNANECAKKRNHSINKKRIQCNMLNPGSSEHFAKIQSLEICPKCQEEFKQPQPEKNEFETIIVEFFQSQEEALLAKAGPNVAHHLIQANSGVFVILDFEAGVPPEFTSYLDAEEMFWFRFAHESDFEKPTVDNPFVDNTTVQPKDGENLRLSEKLVMFMDAYPEGVPELELEERFFSMFPDSKSQFNKQTSLRSFVLNQCYSIIKVISTPSGNRIWASRLRPPIFPTDLFSKFRNPRVLSERTKSRFEDDVRAMSDFEQGGFYLSQFPDLFLKHFGYLHPLQPLKQLLVKVGCVYSTLQVNGGFDIFFQKHVPFQWNSETKPRLIQLLVEEGSIPETRWQTLWERKFGEPFCTESPEKFRTLVQERVPEINYEVVHSERVYKLKGKFKEHVCAMYARVQHKAHGLISCSDVVQAFLIAGRVEKTRVEWTPDETSIQVQFDKNNTGALDKIREISELRVQSELSRKGLSPILGIPIEPKSTTFGYSPGSEFKSSSPTDDFNGHCIHITTVGRNVNFQNRSEISPDDLRNLFSPFGDIQKILLNLQRYPQAWWCLISFSNYQAVEDAISQSEFQIKDMILHVRRPSSPGWNAHNIAVKDLCTTVSTRDLANFFSSKQIRFESIKVFTNDEGVSNGEGLIVLREKAEQEKVLEMRDLELKGSPFTCMMAPLKKAAV